MGGVFALITQVMHQTLSKNVWNQSFRPVRAWLFVSCVLLTSLAFPTWQVCVRDQLEASNTITFPLFTDTHNWPEIEKNTHTEFISYFSTPYHYTWPALNITFTDFHVFYSSGYLGVFFQQCKGKHFMSVLFCSSTPPNQPNGQISPNVFSTFKKCPSS